MGATLTMASEKFAGIHLGVPFVDVLATMCDPSIPLTAPEWEEWGNPNIMEYYEYISKYSPIDNIRRKEYTNTLITAGLFDPRVQYWEPTKFQMKLLDHCTDKNMHILKTDMDKGHFSNTDRYKAIKEKAFMLAFFIKCIS